MPGIKEAFVSSLIKAAASGSPPSSETKAKARHSAPQLRSFLYANRAELEEFLGPNPFEIAVLRKFVSDRIELLPGDLEIGTNASPRWFATLADAAMAMPEVFVRLPGRGRWRILPRY